MKSCLDQTPNKIYLSTRINEKKLKENQYSHII